jgi:hypothetical protein
LACLALLVSLSSRGGGPNALEFKPSWEQTPKHFNRYRFSRKGGVRQQQLLQMAPARREHAPVQGLRYDTEVPYPEGAQPQKNKDDFVWGTNVVWSGANGGGYGFARKPVISRLSAAPMQGLRYDTEVPYPDENSLGQPQNNPNSYMGTNVVWSGPGFARRPRGACPEPPRTQLLSSAPPHPELPHRTAVPTSRATVPNRSEPSLHLPSR